MICTKMYERLVAIFCMLTICHDFILDDFWEIHYSSIEHDGVMGLMICACFGQHIWNSFNFLPHEFNTLEKSYDLLHNYS